MAEKEDGSVASFIDRLRHLNGICSDEARNERKASIVLTTAHSSKGREFDSVLIFDAVDGLFPSSKDNPFRQSKDTALGYQEERRLFYVAMTRARNELTLMRPRREDTPFVDEVIPREPEQQS